MVKKNCGQDSPKKVTYKKEDCAGDMRELPGEFPFTRGIYSSMYQGRLWTMRQYAGFGSAEEANSRYRYLLQQGTTGLSIAFDLPTQMGRDPDHAVSKGEVGRVGVSIATVDDMEQLLAGIPLDKVSISMTINATANILLAFLLVVAERRGVPWSQLTGTVQNDILKEYVARGTYIYPVVDGVRLVTDLFQFCKSEVPRWNTISVSGYHIREAGSTAVQEVAFTLASGIAYLRAAEACALSVDDVAPRMSFFFNCHSNFFEEIAKFRAARRIWASLVKELFAPKDERSLLLRFHTQTAGSTLTAQQPENNIVRTSLQALAAVLGGTQSLHTNAFDEALGLPTEESARIALRTQQVIACESGAAEIADPLGGAFYIEALTEQIESKVRKQIELIDGLGGMVRAVQEGYPQREIEDAAFEAQRKMESGESMIVGVNCFKEDESYVDSARKSNEDAENVQISRIDMFRRQRDTRAVEQVLTELRETVTDGNGGVMRGIIAAARSGCTLGEISDVLRGVFGEYSGNS